MSFSKFMVSGTGRLLRIVAGLVIIYLGFAVIKKTVGDVVGIIGIIPLLAGMLDICVLAPVLGLPLSGKSIRSDH